MNALGDVLDADGRIVAGARGADGSFLDGSRLLRGAQPEDLSLYGNTTLCVVATDAPATQRDLQRMVRMATGAMSRRIRPVNTPFDGDVVFGVAPARHERALPDRTVMTLGDAAREALEEAITRAVLPESRR